MKTTLTLIAAVGLAVPAAAIPADAEPYSVRVQYSDLNLENPEGLARLERRIDKAAREVCGFERVVTGTRVRSSEINACRDKIKAKAMAHIAAAREAQARGG